MADPVGTTAGKRFAVVTGGNKGIGLEICKQLASHGIMMVLTARDEKRGVEAVEILKGLGPNNHVIFHQLDVMDLASIASLAEFIKVKFGKLDILVNNAGISGAAIDADTLAASGTGNSGTINLLKLTAAKTQTYELAEKCLQTNYYGAKNTTETLLPLLQLSDSPRIINISGAIRKLKNISHEWAKGVLGDADHLTEDKLNEVLTKFQDDFKEGSASAQIKGWPIISAYTVSKAALNAYTRYLAHKYPTICINCVCPGYVKTDINYHNGTLSVEEGAEGPVKLALLPNGAPSGLFYVQNEVSSFE